jgi:hypothetical protein
MEAVRQLARFVEPALGVLERLADELRDRPVRTGATPTARG